jgi:hypothetical protein
VKRKVGSKERERKE